MNTQRISDAIRVLDFKTVEGAATSTTAWINMADQDAILAIIQGEIVGTSLDAKLEQATDNSGTGAKDITGLAITQITTDDEGACIECYADSLDLANNFDHVRASYTTVGATTLVTATVVSCDQERYSPLADSAKIVEIIQDA